MDDVISRQETVAALMETFKRNTTTAIRAKLTVEALPSAPQRTGRWVKIKESIKLSEYKCSECGRTVWDDRGYNPYVDYPYCHCGAKMEENNAKLD